MTDVLVPDEDTASATPASGGARPWARATAAAEPGQALWPTPPVVPEAFPTRMARRRAMQADALQDGWSPDPLVTAPVLRRVEDELAALLEAGPASVPSPISKSADATVIAPARPLRRPGRRQLIAALLLVVLVAGLVLTVTLRRAGTPGVRPAATAVSRQDVVVLALAQAGQVTGISLLASGAGPAQQVLVPSRLVLDVPGAGRVPLAQALAPGRSAVAAALADALDVRVDATWVLDTTALAALVDAVGGVVVDVDVDVEADVEANAKGDAGAVVLVAAGPGQRLSGAQAAAYAQWIVGTEPEASRLARQDAVVEAVLGRLPGAATQRRALLAALPDAPTGADLTAVVATTGGMRTDAAVGELASTVLPVNDIDAGGDNPSYGLDERATAALVQARLAGAALVAPLGGRTRVLVQNGVGTPGLGDVARSRLVAAGLRYVGGGNVEGFGVSRTVVLLPDGSSASRRRAAPVLAALGLGQDALRVSDTTPTIADLVVVLGQDFGSGPRP